jgi:hypothetical protein
VELAEIAACDPAVKTLLYFPLIDETAVSTGFQSGNLFADLLPKLSYAVVKNKIAVAHGLCEGGVTGVAQSWSHSAQVLGAVMFGSPGSALGSRPADRTTEATFWSFGVTASERTTFRATLSRLQAGASPKIALTTVGGANAYARPIVTFDPRTLPPGTYRYRITLTAATNPQRKTTLTSRPFKVVGAPISKGRPSS